MKRPDGIVLISIYHFIVAALSMIGMLLLLAIPILVGVSTAAYSPSETGLSVAMTTIMVLAVGIILVVIAGLHLAVGLGLLNFQPWARVTAIVLAAFRVLNFPVGTVIGGLTIWYLLRQDVEPLFVKGSRS